MIPARPLSASLLALVLTSGCGGRPAADPAPAMPPDAIKAQEARNYVDMFRTRDTRQWEMARERLLRLGLPVLPVLFAAMEAEGGSVDENCRAVLRILGPDVLPALDAEISRGDASCTDRALSRRRAFRRSLIMVTGDLKGPTARDLLCRVLQSDPWTTARCNAAFCLGVRKDPQGADALIEALRRDPEELVREECHRALNTLAGKDLGSRPEVWEAWRKQTPAAP